MLFPLDTKNTIIIVLAMDCIMVYIMGEQARHYPGLYKFELV